ncbi:MAG: hypothetical protein KatS3mg114_0892 [Planctomycetaceae bacterium]|jgi:Spy/CpxP family protein refolding chaperone|nr:MAG: hypothetical protein KatS3mg114_0892 [Planctomycetaceae bacterium]
MTANRDDQTRRINCPALRTLHALERTLRRHIDDLMQVDCEDAEAAEAIVFAIEAAEKALDTTRVTRRKVMEG